MEPRPRVSPVAVGSCRGEAKLHRRLFDRQAGKVTQFNESGLDGIFRRKSGQCLVERQEIVAQLWYGQLHLVPVMAYQATSSLDTALPARVLHTDPPPTFGGCGKGIAGVFP